MKRYMAADLEELPGLLEKLVSARLDSKLMQGRKGPTSGKILVDTWEIPR